MIKYKAVKGQPLHTAVYLGIKRAGTIRPVQGGHSYFPKGKDEGGEVFPTVQAVKRSIETS